MCRDMILDIFRTMTKPIVDMICELHLKTKARGVQPKVRYLGIVSPEGLRLTTI
jgi:hypothetical protein